MASSDEEVDLVFATPALLVASQYSLGRRSLPQFALWTFVDSIGVKQRIIERRRCMWDMPGRRPLAQPPIVFNRDDPVIRSDAQYSALFPNDPERICIQKDLDGEAAALLQYLNWVKTTKGHTHVNDPRHLFYHELLEEVTKDSEEVSEASECCLYQASDIGRFEFVWLDRNGTTKNIERQLNEGDDIFYYYAAELRQKYGYLIPPHFELRVFERRLSVPEQGTKEMVTWLEGGHDILKGCHQDIQDKYGHLRSTLRTKEEACGPWRDMLCKNQPCDCYYFEVHLDRQPEARIIIESPYGQAWEKRIIEGSP